MSFSFLSGKRLAIGLHILAWAFIVIIPQYLISVYGGRRDTHFLYQFYVSTVVYGAIFYLHYLWLVPRFFFNDRKTTYILLVTATVLVSCFLLYVVNDRLFFDPERERQMDLMMKELNKGREMVKPPFREMHIFRYFYSAILICGFSLGLGVLERLSQNEKQRKELEKEKLNSELAFLKNQISPHFFFNTLNNIYSLIGFDTEEARQAVLRLSKLMRYLLYESEHRESRLADEVAFLNNYIDLMKLRLGNKVELNISLPDNHGDLLVPPLLFVPFVENAFKHGVSYRERSFIEIRMSVDGSKIRFRARNSLGTSNLPDEVHSGIGLENVRKRLNLLFPGTHTLKIEQAPAAFNVDLLLEIKPLTGEP
ncbi:MAG: histidine kinase [Mangrovibacterium sp.]|nr:histidine kinase [Mangrovibacterium sp.]